MARKPFRRLFLFVLTIPFFLIHSVLAEMPRQKVELPPLSLKSRHNVRLLLQVEWPEGVGFTEGAPLKYEFLSRGGRTRFKPRKGRLLQPAKSPLLVRMRTGSGQERLEFQLDLSGCSKTGEKVCFTQFVTFVQPVEFTPDGKTEQTVRGQVPPMILG